MQIYSQDCIKKYYHYNVIPAVSWAHAKFSEKQLKRNVYPLTYFIHNTPDISDVKGFKEQYMRLRVNIFYFQQILSTGRVFTRMTRLCHVHFVYISVIVYDILNFLCRVSFSLMAKCAPDVYII